MEEFVRKDDGTDKRVFDNINNAKDLLLHKNFKSGD